MRDKPATDRNVPLFSVNELRAVVRGFFAPKLRPEKERLALRSILNYRHGRFVRIENAHARSLSGFSFAHHD